MNWYKMTKNNLQIKIASIIKKAQINQIKIKNEEEAKKRIEYYEQLIEQLVEVIKISHIENISVEWKYQAENKIQKLQEEIQKIQNEWNVKKEQEKIEQINIITPTSKEWKTPDYFFNTLPSNSKTFIFFEEKNKIAFAENNDNHSRMIKKMVENETIIEYINIKNIIEEIKKSVQKEADKENDEEMIETYEEKKESLERISQKNDEEIIKIPYIKNYIEMYIKSNTKKMKIFEGRINEEYQLNKNIISVSVWNKMNNEQIQNLINKIKEYGYEIMNFYQGI